MLNEIFVRRRTIERWQSGPLGPYIAGFVSEMRSHRYSLIVIQNKIRVAGHLSQWLRHRHLTASALSEARLDEFLRRPKSKHKGYPETATALLDYLRRSGIVRQRPMRSSTPSELVELRFSEYLAKERLLADGTRTRQLSRVRRFLSDRYGDGPTHFSRLAAPEITGFVSRYVRDHCHKPRSAEVMITTLRSFLRFLRLEGETDRDLTGCLLGVPRWKLTGLPTALRPKEVQRVIATCDSRTHVGRRNRAILLLLSRLGLRACEILSLSLDDIDWTAGELIVRGKGGRRDRLPLPSDVGAALATYLRFDRRPCKSRDLFVMARAPYGKLAGSEAISAMVTRAIHRAGLQLPRTGAHLLRHTAATQMLRRGASLARIAEVLRHRRTETTAIYAKVDLARLRSIAVRWPGVTL